MYLVGGGGEETAAGGDRARDGAESGGARSGEGLGPESLANGGGAGERAGGARQDGVHGRNGSARVVSYGRSRGSGVDDGAMGCAERPADDVEKASRTGKPIRNRTECASHGTFCISLDKRHPRMCVQSGNSANGAIFSVKQYDYIPIRM